MIVYGDAQYRATVQSLVAGLNGSLDRLSCSPLTLEGVRSALIRAGEVEQAVADASLSPAVERWHLSVRTLTDHLAAAFEVARNAAPGLDCGGGQASLCQARRVLEDLPATPDLELTVRVPEGFAHYALYPEQYARAAECWAAEHPADPHEEALVAGIRSIGTSLSAVVAATLRAAGWNARRLTVRPAGHPWDRKTHLQPAEVGQPAWVLIVDEGPGLSGSSMASVAEALEAAGVDARRIVFLPGHGGQPGSAAPESSRRWWGRVPRIVVSRDELRWQGRALPEALARRVPEFADGAGLVAAIEDFAGGLWRNLACGREAPWPAVCPAWERPKYACRTTGGRSFLWKYHGFCSAGLGSESRALLAMRQLTERAEGGWTHPPLGSAFGFVLTAWAEGGPLTAGDASPDLLRHVGRYIAAVAGPELSAPESDAARQRLRELLYWNTRETLGEEASHRAASCAERAVEALGAHPMRSYGDGRLSPEHWIATPDGRWLKTAATSHDADHTIVGRQPILWDVAGALVEWGLETEEAQPLLRTVPEVAGSGPEVLACYRMAYAAFRMGQCLMSVEQWGGNPAEQDRLRRQADCYRTILGALLAAA